MSVVECPRCTAQLASDARFCGVCGTTIGVGTPAVAVPAATPPTALTPSPRGPDSLIGRTLGGRYKVLSKLGQGGMGTVFRAEQVSVKRNIALKVLDPSLAWDPELIRRFQAEAEVVARLSHPNIVTLFDFGVAEDGLLFIAMELAHGKSLRDVVATEAPLAATRTLDIAEQVVSSLIEAHAHGVIHRDLKPDNVMLSERAGRRDFARVLDFGIAKLRDESQPGTTMTKAGQLLGTPGYMAPEQITGERVDARTDVYALGCLLHELLTGHVPLEAQSPLAMIARQLNERPRPISVSHPHVKCPPALADLIMACLEKSPAGRPPDMVTVGAALAAIRPTLAAGTGVQLTEIEVARTLAAGAPFTPPPQVATPGPATGPAPGVALPPLPSPSAIPVTFEPPPMPVTPPPMPGASFATPAKPFTPPPAPFTPPPVIAAPVATPVPAKTPFAPSPSFAPAPPGTPGALQPPNVILPALGPPPPAKPATMVWALIVVAVVVIGTAIALVATHHASVLGHKPVPDDNEDDPPLATGNVDMPQVTNPDWHNVSSGPRVHFHSDALGYSINMPSGFVMNEDPKTGMGLAQGPIAGGAGSIGVMPVLPPDDVSSRANQIIQLTNGNARIVDRRTRRIDNQDLVSIIYDIPGIGSRFETVFFHGANRTLAVTFATSIGVFDDTAGLRESLFREGFLLD